MSCGYGMNDADPKQTILVVEDDEQIAYLLEFMLNREGFQIVRAADGQRAVELVSGAEPPASLVLLDVMLPYLDGFQVINHIRQAERWCEVPILMLTSKSREHDVIRALDAGANDYVTKPFQPGEIMARIRRLLKDA